MREDVLDEVADLGARAIGARGSFALRRALLVAVDVGGVAVRI